ncbi:MAG: hypothetical protein ACI9EZ_000317 [Halobacteriales archaeon]|jgi:hypothetical protein
MDSYRPASNEYNAHMFQGNLQNPSSGYYWVATELIPL